MTTNDRRTVRLTVIPTSVAALRALYHRCVAYKDYVEDGRWMSDRTDVAPFWTDVFNDPKRTNYPSFSDMLVMRRAATYPIGDLADSSDAERLYAEATYRVVSETVPADFLGAYDESWFGGPKLFDIGSRAYSGGGLVNALTTYRLLHMCRERGLADRPLRILEIGAGYGHTAYQLCQYLDVTQYTVLDLPENLFLSAFYLQAHFPDKHAHFVREDSQSAAAELVFSVPAFMSGLGGPFDLIVNSYSFQEMNLSSVREYLELAATRLSPNGILYSLNAHDKEGSDVAWPSDYLSSSLKLLALQPVRRYPHHYLFATAPYEMVFAASDGERSDLAADETAVHVDALGCLMQLGVHDESLDMCAGVPGRASASQWNWIRHLSNFFRQDVAGKRRALAGMRQAGEWRAVTSYLAGSLAFVLDEDRETHVALEAAAGGIGDPYTQARIALLQALLHGTTTTKASSRRRLDAAAARVPHLTTEIMAAAAGRAHTARAVARQLRLPMERDVDVPAHSFVRAPGDRMRSWLRRTPE